MNKFIKGKYIVFDGVEGDVTYHKTKEDAIKQIEALIKDSVQGNEWMADTDNCFIAKITHYVQEEKITDPEIVPMDFDYLVDYKIKEYENVIDN